MSAYTQYDFGIYSKRDRDRFGKMRETFLGGAIDGKSRYFKLGTTLRPVEGSYQCPSTTPAITTASRLTPTRSRSRLALNSSR